MAHLYKEYGVIAVDFRSRSLIELLKGVECEATRIKFDADGSATDPEKIKVTVRFVELGRFPEVSNFHPPLYEVSAKAFITGIATMETEVRVSMWHSEAEDGVLRDIAGVKVRGFGGYNIANPSL